MTAALRLGAAFGGGGSSSREIAHTDEIDRVRDLPRRRWSEDSPETRTLIDQMTTWARLASPTCGDPACPYYHEPLRAVQALALAELHAYGGMFGPIPVGFGKTLITFLAPSAIGAKRPLLLVPAKLREKTAREFAHLAKHFRAPPTLRIESYEVLARDYGAKDAGGLGMLDLANPDLLLLEECHRAKNTKAATTKKIKRFMRMNPATPVLAVSGTITNRSIHDYAHVEDWCLKQGTPLPRSWEGRNEWAFALDEKVNAAERLRPGALLAFCEPSDWEDGADERTAARRGYRRRLIETPGVVATAKIYDGASLMISAVEPAYSQATEAAFEILRSAALRPDGSTLISGLEAWSVARQLAVGMFYRWSPWPPEEWKAARSAWARIVRDVLGQNGHGFDSPGQIVAAIDQMYSGDRWKEVRQLYANWIAVKDTFEPNVVATWIDNGPLNTAAEWMASHRGIVWVEHVEFGDQLAELTGQPYYGRQGLDPRGRFIDDARPRDGSIIASIASNNEGRNLQLHWSENLITSPMPTGTAWEQTIGRTHRPGQPEDEVTVEVFVGCREQAGAWFQALRDSACSRDTVTGVPAKIHYADTVMPNESDVPQWASFSKRWA